MCKYPMYTSKRCTDMTYYHYRTEGHMGSGFIACNMGYHLESQRVDGGKTLRVTDNKGKHTGTQDERVLTSNNILFYNEIHFYTNTPNINTIEVFRKM